MAPMKIILITPALPHSRAGNRATAIRWKNILVDLGHRVEVATEYTKKNYDVMVALHAWRSAKPIQQFEIDAPNKPLIVALTGTDLYKFIKTHPKPTLHSIKIADALITLHDLAHLAIPKIYRNKVFVIHQSAKAIAKKKKNNKRYFDICVMGHLREEKDPLRTAYAVRNLPKSSRIRVRQFGKAHSQPWAERALKEMQINPRYHWYAEVPHWRVRKEYASADLMVLSSRMEGGANVISEACVAGLPIVASDIDGSIGLLGKDYAGYYAVGNTKSLRNLLLRVETDRALLNKLQLTCRKKAKLFTYEKEKNGWKKVLNKFI